jgi:hypothetical protein
MSHLEPMSETAHSPAPPYPKLPLWRTIGLSYSTYFHHFTDALRTSWIWFVAVGLLTGLASLQQWSWIAAVLERGAPSRTLPAQPFETALLFDLAYALLLFAGVSIAVAWHRLMIQGERPGLSASNIATGNLWRYIGIALVFMLITILPLLLIAVPVLYLIPSSQAAGTAPPSGFGALILATVLLSMFAAAAVLRLSLLLPARAVGNISLTFKQAWNRTRGNTWRMIWGIFFCTVPPLLLAQVGFFLTVGFSLAARRSGEDLVAQMTANSVVFVIYYLLIVPIGIGFLSHAYRYFFQGGIEAALEIG